MATDYNDINFRNSSIDKMSDKFGFIKVNKEVIKTPEGKHIEVDRFNKITGKGVSKEKDITFKSENQPREKYVEKQIVRRDKDLNWKSEKTSKSLSVGGKKVKSESNFNRYK
jgi:hypothetical protein